MDDGLNDLIEELEEYGRTRKGELAVMVLEAANRLREMSGLDNRAKEKAEEHLRNIDDITRKEAAVIIRGLRNNWTVQSGWDLRDRRALQMGADALVVLDEIESEITICKRKLKEIAG